MNDMQNDLHHSKDWENKMLRTIDLRILLPGPQMLEWRKVIPNALTVLACVVGLSAVKLALDGDYQQSVIAILVAGLLDGCDGPVARAIGGTSRFGAELDSLMDFVNFGVSPTLVLYLWGYRDTGWSGFGTCVIYAVCMGCRLARFNAGVDFNASQWGRNFFMGVPAPAGAYLVLQPLAISFWLRCSDRCIETFGRENVSIYILFVAFCLVSRTPTFSSKMLNRTLIGQITPWKMTVFAAIVVILGYLFIHFRWATVVGIAIGYIICMPIAFSTFQFLDKKEKKEIIKKKMPEKFSPKKR
eukprot:TRINITY_DN21788_c0_g1_i1.p1 TRINITY_DN21788_c0_g1~~TRINITY_DN21788_c0_g1_i1.p1  ORF type:complete len:320 (+),score=66.93 TRINITY_DN21788_c0_g1_i1:63-962(+)